MARSWECTSLGERKRRKTFSLLLLSMFFVSLSVVSFAQNTCVPSYKEDVGLAEEDRKFYNRIAYDQAKPSPHPYMEVIWAIAKRNHSFFERCFLSLKV